MDDFIEVLDFGLYNEKKTDELKEKICCLCGINEKNHKNKQHRFFTAHYHNRCKKCNKFFYEHNHMKNSCFDPYDNLSMNSR